MVCSFFLRCWRAHIKSSDEYSLMEHFISNNAYTCVEINAHNLIEIVRKLRSTREENLFLPILFASQPCEHIFRMVRSMGTINYTKINFWLNELLHMIARVDIINKTMYTCKEIEFPRLSKEKSSNILSKLPADDEIKEIIENAQTHALQEAVRFGIFSLLNEIKYPEIKTRPLETTTDSDNEDNSDQDSDDEPRDQQVLSLGLYEGMK